MACLRVDAGDDGVADAVAADRAGELCWLALDGDEDLDRAGLAAAGPAAVGQWQHDGLGDHRGASLAGGVGVVPPVPGGSPSVGRPSGVAVVVAEKTTDI